MDTNNLIQQLGSEGRPVRPLPRPLTRTVVWLAMGAVYVAAVVVMMTPRTDLLLKFSEGRYFIEQCAALVTGIAAAVAAFASVIPGMNRKVLLVPLVPLAVWVGSLGQGCVSDWVKSGIGGLSLQPDWLCFPAIALIGAGPAVTIAWMIRRGAPLSPHLTAALGGLAAAGLGNFGLRLFHPQDASLMVLVWQFGSVFILSILAALSGRYVLSWQSVINRVRAGVAIGR
jgi:hypothetical protein